MARSHFQTRGSYGFAADGPPNTGNGTTVSAATRDDLSKVRSGIRSRISGIGSLLCDADIDDIAGDRFEEAAKVSKKTGESLAVLLSNRRHLRPRWVGDRKAHAARVVPHAFAVADPDSTQQDFEPSDGDSLVGEVVQFEDEVADRLDFAAFMGSLPERDRRIAELRDDGLGLDEIGKKMDIGKSSVDRSLKRTGAALLARREDRRQFAEAA